MPPRRRVPSEELSESYDESDVDGSAIVDELSTDEIPGEIASANCRVMSTRELFQQMMNRQIDVEPPYQRDVVWAKNAQSALIDSIFKNKWVPTLLFSERVLSVEVKGSGTQGSSYKKKRIWVCMDGKQRLTSIKFLTGQIPWIRQPGKQWYFKQTNPPSPSRLIISDELQEVFLSRGITTALYAGLTEFQERDIFRLVQEGKPLTIGEKMQAAAGPWGEYFDELTRQYMVRDEKRPNGWVGRITKLPRGADFKTITQMVLLIRDKEIHDPPGLLTAQQLQKELVTLQDTPVPDKLKREVTMLLDMFMEISLLAPPNTQYTHELNTPEAMYAPIVGGRKTHISPVEMVWIPYMISHHGRSISIGRLLELIELFKVEIRKRYPREVKNNRDVTQWIIKWIKTVDTSLLKGKFSGYRVPRLPDPPRTATSSTVTSPPDLNRRSDRPEQRLNGPSSPGTGTQTKRKINTTVKEADPTNSAPKRPRPSVLSTTNLARPSTAQGALSKLTPVSNSARPELSATGSFVNGKGSAGANVGSLFANRVELRPTQQTSSFSNTNTSAATTPSSQFGVASSFRRTMENHGLSTSQPGSARNSTDSVRPRLHFLPDQ